MLKQDDTELIEIAREELPLEIKKSELEDELKILLLPKDPNDDKNLILEIRPEPTDKLPLLHLIYIDIC